MTSRRSAIAAFDMQVINQYKISTGFRLVYVLDSKSLLIIVSRKDGVRQVAFNAEDVGENVQRFLAGLDPSQVASRVQSSDGTRELDDDQFFLAVASNILKIYKKGILADDIYAQHLEEIGYWREACNAEGCINYLHLENLSDVVEDSMVYRVKPEEISFWNLIWKSVVTKSGSIC